MRPKSELETVNLLKTCLAIFALSIFLTACQLDGGSKSNVPRTAPAPPAGSIGATTTVSGGGGIDGSGGDVQQSSFEQVRTALTEEVRLLERRLIKIETVLSQQDTEIFDYSFGQGASVEVRAFLTGKGSLVEAVKSRRIQIKAQREACPSREGDHAGSATGDLNSGTICISAQRLQSLPPQILKEEIFGLLIHELSHLAGFNESRARGLQQRVLANKRMYSDYYQPGFTASISACDVEQLQKEKEELNRSAYWTEQKRKLVELLEGTQQRGCSAIAPSIKDKLFIFSDDAEYLHITRKFPPAGFRFEQLTDWRARASSVSMGIDFVQELSMVPSITISTRTKTISGLTGLIGTDAQCSPKVLLANVIASVPDILELACGEKGTDVHSTERVRTRIAEELRILREAR